MTLPRRFATYHQLAVRELAVLAFLCGFCPNLHAEQVGVTVSSSVNFTVLNVAASSSGSPSATVNYSSASLTSGHKLKISVQAGAANFTTSTGSAIPASNVQWTVASASGGSGSSGTLSASTWTQVYLSNANPSSGSIALDFSLAAPGGSVKAVTQILDLQWKFESVP